MFLRLPRFLRATPTPAANRRRCGLAVGLLSSAALLCGCAKQPPGSGSSIALSGHRLHVVITFSAAINPNYHYYFLINYDQSQGTIGNQNAPGPVPILTTSTQGQQTPGNGFAASSDGTPTPGFTDFVRFEGAYRLLHVSSSDPTGRIFIDEGMPDSFVMPSTDPASNNSKVLQFDIDLSHLVAAANGGGLSATDTVNQAKLIKWLQVNIVATDSISIDPHALKQVDSLGDTRIPAQAASFLNLNVLDTRTYLNGDTGLFEPGDNDVVGSANPDPSLDITPDYKITVTQQ